MFSSKPPPPNEILSQYRTTYNHLFSNNEIKPLIYPYHFAAVNAVILYFLIPHRNAPWLYKARWGLLAWVVWFEIKALREVRCMSMAFSYVAGLVAAWCVVWSFTVLVWNRPQWEFKRVEVWGKGDDIWRLRGGGKGEGGGGSGDDETMKPLGNGVNGRMSNGNTASGSQTVVEKVLRNRNGMGSDANTLEDREDITPPRYYWQSYPDGNAPFRERLSWVLDMLLNFRGAGWNWAIPSLPPLPEYITCRLENPSEVPATKKLYEDSSKNAGINNKTQRSSTPSNRKYNITKFCLSYIFLDFLKTIMMHDTYFYLGPTTYPPPSYLPSLILNSPILLKLYRCTITMTACVVSIDMSFVTAPLIFSYLLGPRVLGLRGEEFMYPGVWGRFSSVLDKGIAGLWGGWWHQTFRFAFSSPTIWLIRNGWINKRSMSAKVVGLIVAFGISGFLHFSGSITQLGDTNPFGPPTFFLLQGILMLTQTTFCAIFHNQLKAIPRSIRRFGNFLIVFTGLYHTASFFNDDIARGGVWLYEPIPVSLFRGVVGDGWWCWGKQHGEGGGIGIGWYWGREGRWWESGLAVF